MCNPNGHFSESMEEEVGEIKEIIIDQLIVYMSGQNVTPNIATSLTIFNVKGILLQVFFFPFS